MIDLFTPYIGEAVAALIGGFVMWWPTRKKSQIDNQQAIVDLYQETLTDLKQRYEEKFQDLKATFDTRLEKVMEEVKDLKRQLDEWQRKYYNLKQAFDKYKKDHP